MWPGVLGGLFAIILVAQAADTRGCRTPDPNTPTPTPSPSPTPTPSPSSEIFTTQDGVRFQVETVATNLDVPWSLAFAPDGRLFVTERPGRVRILNLAMRSSELALTV